VGDEASQSGAGAQQPGAPVSHPAAPRAGEHPQPSPATSEKASPRRSDSALADVTELSLYTFFVDALIDTDRGSEKELLRWMHAAIGFLDADADVGSTPGDTRWELLELLRWSLWHRKGNPATMPTAHLFLALHVVTRMVRQARITREDASPSASLEQEWGSRWRSLVDAAEEAIETCRTRMREDMAAPGEGPARRSGRRYSDRLRALEIWAGRMAEKAHENVSPREREKSVPTSHPQLKRRDSGRILFSAPLAVLWAVHNRLSIRRRTRTLLRSDAKLLTRIEALLESNEYSNEFRSWKKWVAESPP
jgi:hypothetical protein